MSTFSDDSDSASEILQGRRVVLVGRLASMAKREAAQVIRRHGGIVVEKPGAPVDLVVIGEEDLPLADSPELDAWLDEPARQAAEQGSLEVIGETQLWQRLRLVDQEPEVHRLYTPAMLAELLGVPVAVIRRWHRRRLIVPAREVRRLPYFDFQEVATARRLAELLAAGVSPRALEKKLALLARYVPGVARPLAQLSVIVEGREILLRQGAGLVEPGGQLRFDFGAAEAEQPGEAAGGPATGAALGMLSMALGGAQAAHEPPTPVSAEAMRRMAGDLEDAGQLQEAADMYRAAMAAAGPSAEVCFQLAEVLYRLGDLGAARERYAVAIELDEDYVEARANLGCVLAETGRRDLAAAAFEGALAYHPDYADAHYLLARTLDELARRDEALGHWRAFLDLAPDSPWAEQARARLLEADGTSGFPGANSGGVENP